MRAREIMTREPACCTPDSTAEEVARLMRDNDCGVIPVVDGGEVVGLVHEGQMHQILRRRTG